MSDEKGTAGSYEGETSNEDAMSLEEKIGRAKNFDKEMKDYAKATVKEFLGIYGYEEEEEEDVNMDESESSRSHETQKNSDTDVDKHKETSNSPSAPTMVTSESEYEACKDKEHPVSSVRISSSTTNVETEEDTMSEVFPSKEVPCPESGLSSFSWDEYIAEKGGILAPWTCFKQSSTPPFNGFQCGMKVEVLDPRSEDGAICVATVVGVIGSRIRLRFDGCSSAYDIWTVIDSGNIHPIGWCEGNGGVLKPPVGFKMQGSSFKSFLQKALADGELAPLRLFKKEPSSPKVNLFCPTFKLEAVDPSHPAHVCVASVKNVIADDVYIEFDGRPGRVYKYSFYSRDIFPPGWSYFSGHPLHSPQGFKKLPLVMLKERQVHHGFRPQSKKTDLAEGINPAHETVQHSTEKADSVSDDHHSSYIIPGEVELHVNYNCEFGSYLDPIKLSTLHPVYRGNVRDVLQASIQAIVNAAYDPSVVIGFLRPGRGKIIIKAKHNKETYTCCLQSIDHVWVMWNVIGRFIDNLRCCKNLFSANMLHGTCPKCNDQGKKLREREVARLAEQERVQKELRMEELRNEAKTLEQKQLKQVKEQEFLLQQQVKKRQQDQTKELETKRRRISPIEKIPEVTSDVESTSSPLTWSVDEVVGYFQKSDITKYAEQFREHEIDGGALLLLNRETIMSCMNFKLGPALKLLNHISDLKTKFGISTVK